MSQKVAALTREPLAVRLSTPGSVRWSVDMGEPVTFIRWSPLAGLVVSVGREVHNVTSRGEDRWRYVGGENHTLFALNSTEIIWSPDFKQLTQLMARGRRGWSREWDGKLVSDSNGDIYLLDASTISAIGEDGKDKWRASPEGLRRLEGPFVCGGGLLFHGLSGLLRVAVLISNSGAVIRETPLERGAVLIGAGPSCEPLIAAGGEIAMLDARGHALWRRPSVESPFVARLDGGFAVVNARADKSARLEIVSDIGRPVQSVDLPISGRITAVGVESRAGLKIDAIGLCTDVTSPCSKPDDHRGPFNALMTSTPKNDYRSLIRHVQGNLNFAPYDDGGLIVASSSVDTETDLQLRDSSSTVVWQVTLPGRLSAGPYVGPSGEVYIGTCLGWECSAPHLLTAVTGREPPPDEGE